MEGWLVEPMRIRAALELGGPRFPGCWQRGFQFLPAE